MPRVTGRAPAHATLRISTRASTADWANALAWTADGRAIAVASADGAVLDIGCDGSVRELARHAGAATCVAVASSGAVATGGHDGTVRIAGTVVHEGDGWVERLAWRPDGARLAIAQGRRVALIDPQGGATVDSAPLDSTVTCIGWHPRGVHLAAGHYGGVLMLRGRDARADTRLAWNGSVLELAISPDGRRLAHGNQDATVHFWEIAKRRELHMWGYATKVRQLAWRDDGRFLATGGGPTVTIWDFAGRGPEGSRPIELDHHNDLVSWLGFRAGDELLASAGDDGLLVLWHPGRDDAVHAAVAMDAAITCGAWSPDGDALAVATADGSVAICSLASG